MGTPPLPIHPLTRHAASILARQIHTGPRPLDLNVDDVIDVLNPAFRPVQRQRGGFHQPAVDGLRYFATTLAPTSARR